MQVEFDKNQVLSYRQLGYENRAIADVNFRNDAVDAGEVGAGQQVVALYEVVLRNADPSNETPLATTRVRYKAPYGKLLAKASGGSGQPGASADGDKQLGANEATEIESSFYWNQSSGLFDGASIGFQKSALSAQFAEFLRRSSHAKNDSLSLLRYKLEELAKTTGDPEVIELSALVQLAQPQLEPALLAQNSLRRAADELQRFEYDCLRTSYVDGDQSEDWLVSTNATREHLRESLRIEVYEARGIENR
ncbi:MAG: Ca-activated chloride channel family protein [Planctomycetota bacterium]